MKKSNLLALGRPGFAGLPGGMEANGATGEGDCSVDAIVLLPVRPEKISGWTGREFSASRATGRVTVRMFGQEGPFWAIEGEECRLTMFLKRTARLGSLPGKCAPYRGGSMKSSTKSIGHQQIWLATKMTPNAGKLGAVRRQEGAIN